MIKVQINHDFGLSYFSVKVLHSRSKTKCYPSSNWTELNWNCVSCNETAHSSMSFSTVMCFLWNGQIRKDMSQILISVYSSYQHWMCIEHSNRTANRATYLMPATSTTVSAFSSNKATGNLSTSSNCINHLFTVTGLHTHFQRPHTAQSKGVHWESAG